jgi:hypothetical protein
MPSTILLPEKIETADSPKALNEAVWNAWLDRNAAEDRRKHAFRMELTRWGSIGLLLLAAGLSFQHAFVYPLIATKVVQFALTLSAIAFAWQASSSRWYALAVAFLIVAIAFNPLLPSSWVFRNSPVLLLCTLPFIGGAYQGKRQTKATVSSTEASHAE